MKVCCKHLLGSLSSQEQYKNRHGWILIHPLHGKNVITSEIIRHSNVRSDSCQLPELKGGF